MGDELVEYLIKSIQQLGLPTVILLIFILLVYRFSAKVLIPLSNKLVDGHLNFLNNMEEILAKQAEQINDANNKQIANHALTTDKFNTLHLTTTEIKSKVNDIHKRFISQREDDDKND